jgi:hypothetical protein
MVIFMQLSQMRARKRWNKVRKDTPLLLIDDSLETWGDAGVCTWVRLFAHQNDDNKRPAIDD